MEEIHRRDFGVYAKRTLLAEGRLSRYGSLTNLPVLFFMVGAGNPSTQEDPMIYIPLNLDRLRAGITILCDLLWFVRAHELPSIIPNRY